MKIQHFSIESIFYIDPSNFSSRRPPAFTDSCVSLCHFRRDEQMASTMSRTASLIALLALPVASFITSRSPATTVLRGRRPLTTSSPPTLAPQRA